MASDHMVGHVLGGRYEIRELIAEEELGKVYVANGPDGPVQVKLLKPLDHSNPERLARFGREMMASAVVKHANTVAMLDFGSDGIYHYVVLEHVVGPRLSEILKQEPRLAPPRAARIALGVTRALEAARSEKILHRNLNPRNLLLVDGTDEVKVCDFGLCRLEEDAQDHRLTAKGTRVGRPEYMAPEYVSFHDVGAEGDLYALGVVLFEMLVGQPPFTGATERVLQLQAEAPAPPPSAVRPDVPPWLDDLVTRLLDKDPARRPTHAEVITALEQGLATQVSRPSRAPWVAAGLLALIAAVAAWVLLG